MSSGGSGASSVVQSFCTSVGLSPSASHALQAQFRRTPVHLLAALSNTQVKERVRAARAGLRRSEGAGTTSAEELDLELAHMLLLHFRVRVTTDTEADAQQVMDSLSARPPVSGAPAAAAEAVYASSASVSLDVSPPPAGTASSPVAAPFPLVAASGAPWADVADRPVHFFAECPEVSARLMAMSAFIVMASYYIGLALNVRQLVLLHIAMEQSMFEPLGDSCRTDPVINVTTCVSLDQHISAIQLLNGRAEEVMTYGCDAFYSWQTTPTQALLPTNASDATCMTSCKTTDGMSLDMEYIRNNPTICRSTDAAALNTHSAPSLLPTEVQALSSVLLIDVTPSKWLYQTPNDTPLDLVAKLSYTQSSSTSAICSCTFALPAGEAGQVTVLFPSKSAVSVLVQLVHPVVWPLLLVVVSKEGGKLLLFFMLFLRRATRFSWWTAFVHQHLLIAPLWLCIGRVYRLSFLTPASSSTQFRASVVGLFTEAIPMFYINCCLVVAVGLNGGASSLSALTIASLVWNIGRIAHGTYTLSRMCFQAASDVHAELRITDDTSSKETAGDTSEYAATHIAMQPCDADEQLMAA